MRVKNSVPKKIVGSGFDQVNENSNERTVITPAELADGTKNHASSENRVRSGSEETCTGSVQVSDRGVSDRGTSSELSLETSETPIADAIEAYIPDMRAYAKRLCKDDTLADDLVQDTCMKAWAARKSFHSGAEARPWLFRILRNEYYQITRRSWRNVAYDQEEAERTLVATTNLESASDLRVMKSMLEQLPTNQYEAMLLVVAGGFTYEEVAVICDTSAGTVKSRVSRGREALHRLMEMQAAGGAAPASKTEDACVMTTIVEDIARIVNAAEKRAA